LQGFSGKACDVWALGATIFSFAYLKPPYIAESGDMGDLIAAIVNY